MLELIAIAREDGWAFVRKEDQIVLVRPPYNLANLNRVSEESVARAILVAGFSEYTQTFASWDGLIAFLNQQVVEAREEKAQRIPDIPSEELLELAPNDVLENFLLRIETELLPSQEWDYAENILLKMLMLKIVGQNENLRIRTAILLKRLTDEKKAWQVRKTQLADATIDISQEFPLATLRYGGSPIIEYANSIAERHQVLAVVG